jgi:O-antigen/teichoic acid export membrane protein
MLVFIQTISCLAFAYVSYLLASVLADSLKESKLVKSISITVCCVTIAYHFHHTGMWAYIVSAFVGFFLHTCVSGYTRKVKAPSRKNKSKVKVVNINP